jgi:hypothetical protein
LPLRLQPQQQLAGISSTRSTGNYSVQMPHLEDDTSSEHHATIEWSRDAM